MCLMYTLGWTSKTNGKNLSVSYYTSLQTASEFAKGVARHIRSIQPYASDESSIVFEINQTVHNGKQKLIGRFPHQANLKFDESRFEQWFDLLLNVSGAKPSYRPRSIKIRKQSDIIQIVFVSYRGGCCERMYSVQKMPKCLRKFLHSHHADLIHYDNDRWLTYHFFGGKIDRLHDEIFYSKDMLVTPVNVSRLYALLALYQRYPDLLSPSQYYAERYFEIFMNVYDNPVARNVVRNIIKLLPGSKEFVQSKVGRLRNMCSFLDSIASSSGEDDLVELGDKTPVTVMAQ